MRKVLSLRHRAPTLRLWYKYLTLLRHMVAEDLGEVVLEAEIIFSNDFKTASETICNNMDRRRM